MYCVEFYDKFPQKRETTEPILIVHIYDMYKTIIDFHVTV